MDPLFVGYYERELKHVREMGGEFARRFPKIAGRLGLDAFACADPYVERLIEAFAFMTARIQLKLAAAHGDFTEHMLQLLYPDYLAPTPSMAVMQFVPNQRQGSLGQGVVIPRGSAVRSELGPKQQTACEYRTAHPVTLWPVSIVSVDYRANPGELVHMERVAMPEAKAALRIVLQTERGARFDELPIERLPLFLRGKNEVTAHLYEQLLSANIGMVVQPTTRPVEFMHVHDKRVTAALGFEDDHALLPSGDRHFEGYRLLQEFFAFPERYMFVELRDLKPLLRQSATDTLEIVLLFDRAEPRLDGVVQASHLALYCTPAINLFPRTSDRVQLSANDAEHHVVPDRMRPNDFEVHSVTRVVGYGDSPGHAGEFTPMYAPVWHKGQDRRNMSYTVRRRPSALKSSLMPHEQDTRTPYVPSETYLALVDGEHGQFRPGMQQLGVDTLCTNRALPLTLTPRGGHLTFENHSGAPVEVVRCIAGPTPPRASAAFGDTSWGLISHLSMDFMTLIRKEGDGAGALRRLLGLYSSCAARDHFSQIDGIANVTTQGVVRPLPFDGQMTFGRGIQVTLTCDDRAFAGTSAFLLGAVLNRFFAKYASINSFTETVLRSQQRGEVMRWPIAAGRRSTL
ncbi:MAG: type VI secretion system baseplate subunit TssF [Polyangiales bacterium]